MIGADNRRERRAIILFSISKRLENDCSKHSEESKCNPKMPVLLDCRLECGQGGIETVMSV